MPTPRGADGEQPDEERSWRQLLGPGLLIGSIAFVLLLGAVLQDDPVATDRTALEPAAGPPPDLERIRPIATERGPAPSDALARRVGEDLERVASHADEWTAQVALLCDSARAREILAEFQGERELYLLPGEHAGQACFLLCFGHFPSAELARATAGLPAGLRSIAPHPFPKRLADVLEVLQ